MTPTPEIRREFYGLMDALRDGNLSEPQKVRLDQLLRQYETLQDDYIEYTLLCQALHSYQPLSQEERSCVTAGMVDREAIEHEAQRRLDRFLAEQEEIRRLQRPDPRSRPSLDLGEAALRIGQWLSSLYRVVVGGAIVTAVMLTILLVVHYARPNPVVARLADSMGARWDTDVQIPKEADLHRDSFRLEQGYARLVFQRGAGVWIEAPAEFRLKSANKMALQSGRLFAEVPPSAKGFAVDTPYSRVVDLGTQFGVRVETDMASDLHLFKGRASVIPGKIGVAGRGRTLIEGQARRVDAAGQVQDIPINTTAFVRRFFPGSGMAWRGEAIDLADVVGGGNGLGTGQLNRWLAIGTGQDGTTYIVNGNQMAAYQVTDNQYHRVSHLPYVDGVFSPDGGAGPIRVSSRDHTWKDCPKTSGQFFEDIFNGDYIFVQGNSHRLVLAGQAYGTRGHPAIALHTNAGITFDLDALRGDLPGLEVVRFRALCGISEEVKVYQGQTPATKADFWVLVDGDKRFETIGRGVNSPPQEISISLNKEDRFLTLASTDGDGQANYDWSLFAEPRLDVSVAEQK